MTEISAQEVANRLKLIYDEQILSCGKYLEICNGCRQWFSTEFDNPNEFQKRYIITDYSIVNILSLCLKSKRHMSDFLSICNPWALWHFDISIHKSILGFQEQGIVMQYSAPISDVQFLKRFALFVR